MPDTVFFIKFDPITGERISTIPYDSDVTPEAAKELLAAGYELVPHADWNLMVGNVDGQEYIKDVVNGGYIVKPKIVPTVEEAKASKIAELKSIRDGKELEPVQYGGNLYDFDTKSFDRINAAIIALDQTQGTIGWTCADNKVVEVNTDTLRGVIASAAIRSNALHIIYRELKEAVNAATAVADVESINWPEV